MKNKQLVLEHKNMMYYSREIIQLSLPKEIDAVFYTILALFLCVCVFLVSVKINDVIKVSGIVRTQENNSTVSNILDGEIKTIFYEPEQYVQKGDILYSLKDDVYLSVLKDLESEIENNKEELLCVNSLINGFDLGENIISKKDNLLIYSQLEEFFKTQEYLLRQIEISDYKYQKELNQPAAFYNQRSVDEAKMNYQLCQKELEKYRASFLSELMQRKKAIEHNLDKLNQEMIRTKQQYSFLEIKAPISGYIQEISSLNVGDFIFANQSVLMIIPDDAKNFRVELSVPTKDIGQITNGLKVKYRLSAFPFFEYRGAEGIIKSVGSDVRQSGKNQLYYQVYSDIDKVSFTNNKGDEYPLRAGIEIDARIVLEKISIVHFILRKLDFVQ